MITKFFLSIPAFILSAVLSIIPNGGTLPQGFIDAVNYLWGFVAPFAVVIPVGALLSVLSVVVLYEVGVFGFHIFSWILKKVPGMQ